MELREFTSELTVILLSIVLITGISLIPTLQIGVQGQIRYSPPPTPGTTSVPSTTTTTTRPPPDFGAADGAADQTEGSGAADQSATVMIPQSSVMMILDNLQTLMDAVADDEDAMMALESIDQILRSAATAAGMSVENTTDEGDGT